MTCDIVDIFMANEGKDLIYDILLVALMLPLYISSGSIKFFNDEDVSYICQGSVHHEEETVIG